MFHAGVQLRLPPAPLKGRSDEKIDALHFEDLMQGLYSERARLEDQLQSLHLEVDRLRSSLTHKDAEPPLDPKDPWAFSEVHVQSHLDSRIHLLPDVKLRKVSRPRPNVVGAPSFCMFHDERCDPGCSSGREPSNGHNDHAIYTNGSNSGVQSTSTLKSHAGSTACVAHGSMVTQTAEAFVRAEASTVRIKDEAFRDLSMEHSGHHSGPVQREAFGVEGETSGRCESLVVAATVSDARYRHEPQSHSCSRSTVRSTIRETIIRDMCSHPSMRSTAKKQRTGEEVRRLSKTAVILYDVDEAILDDAEHTRCRAFVKWLLLWPGFDLFVMTILCMDFMLIGVYAQDRLNPFLGATGKNLLDYVDHTFKSVYAMELVLRFYGFGLKFCCGNKFIRLDIGLGVLDAFSTVAQISFGNSPEMQILTIVRIMRVARVARLIRLTVQLRTLWLLVSGLAHSASTIFWTFILIATITYCFAILGMELIPPGGTGVLDVEQLSFSEGVALEKFGNLVNAMLTLLQVLTLDSIAQIYRPLITEGDGGVVCALYFILYILFVSIALMNLVTAVMVEGSLRQAAQDREFLSKIAEQQRARLLPEMRKMFMEIDTDHTGEVDIEELVRAEDEFKMRLMDLTGSEDPVEIFLLLDTDDDGVLSIDEFMEGLLKASQGAKLQDFQLSRIMRLVDQLKMTLMESEKKRMVEMKSGQFRWKKQRNEALQQRPKDCSRGVAAATFRPRAVSGVDSRLSQL
eukprot:TRINITY_DN74863_c0_g1_i1.p1 TRINITY_DN74863_c0_g1~~TRINITY_DN74863_c0_g1_i1.p1  ORF type:complete len:742 (+),score=145.58 TRINITY_DN74863_c0_g1_i1:107-2332(+)